MPTLKTWKICFFSKFAQDPLGKWHHGRAILIGDAAHAMLPTQGQGASQAIEDAEALGSFFRDICDPPPFEDLSQIFQV